MKTGAELHIETGQRMLLEAGSELTVKAGGSWLKIDASGIRIQGGRIDIMGGGKAGQGMPADPALPNGPGGVEISPPPHMERLCFPPGQKKALTESAKAHRLFCAICAREEA